MEKKKITLASWDKICRPKHEGGLNIKQCNHWNIASIGKLIWMLKEKKYTLWVKWVNEVYMKQSSNFGWIHLLKIVDGTRRYNIN